MSKDQLDKLRRQFDIAAEKRAKATYLAGNGWEAKASALYNAWAAASNALGEGPYIMTGRN